MRAGRCCRSLTLLSHSWEIPTHPSSANPEALPPKGPLLMLPLPSWLWWMTREAKLAVSIAKSAVIMAACIDHEMAGEILLDKYSVRRFTWKAVAEGDSSLFILDDWVRGLLVQSCAFLLPPPPLWNTTVFLGLKLRRRISWLSLQLEMSQLW